MPGKNMKAFVHGNPETADIWKPLVAELKLHGVDDVALLTPPGFGARPPKGWEATPAAYVEWLAGQLEELGGNVDLVGHDWGAGHTFGLAATRPDLLRSYAADCGGLLHPDYVWHDAAQGWQTPDLGEQMMDGMLDAGADGLTAAYQGFGLSEDIARPMAEAFNGDMAHCILTLYRAAKQPHLKLLGDRLAGADKRPALLIVPTEDPYVPAELAMPVAERLGARTLQLEGLGHWWMVESPERAARGLLDFWTVA